MQKRKLLLSIALVAVLLFTALVPSTTKAADIPGVMVNNRTITSNATPVSFNGTLLFTAKELLASLGGTFNYDNTSMTGIIKQGENELVFRLDSDIVRFNGKYIKAPAPMKVMGYRFMVPVQFVAERLGAQSFMDTGRNIMMVFQPQNGRIIYQVMSGDSLWRISQLFGTTITAIMQKNGLTSTTIYLGQKLIVKDFTPVSTTSPATVTSGATLRSGAGFGFTGIAYIPAATNISIAGKSGDWYKVTTPKGNGYLYYSVVKVTQDIADISAASTYFNTRATIDTSGDTVTYTDYTVQKGDTIWSISEKSGIPNYELASVNNISLSSYLSIGQVIKIPVHTIAEKVKLGPQYGELLDWATEGQYVFPIGKTGKFIDMKTGKSFMAQRTMGANHSDTETLTAEDTQAMKEIFGGSWTWNRRAFILEVDGRRFAVSVAGMAHAGVDGAPYLQTVDNRSDNWGTGPNYDRIPGNGMDGHFDVYFLNGLRHSDGNMDPAHQYKVMVAGGLQ